MLTASFETKKQKNDLTVLQNNIYSFTSADYYNAPELKQLRVCYIREVFSICYRNHVSKIVS